MAKGRQKQKARDRKNEIAIEIERRNNLFDKLIGKQFNLEQAQKLLDELSAPIKYGGFSRKLDDIPSEYPTPGSKKLRSNIETIGTGPQIRVELEGILKQLKTKLDKISDDNDYKKNVTSIVEKVETDIQEFLSKPVKNVISSYGQFKDQVAQDALKAKSNFQPSVWHKVADVLIWFLNGLKNIGRKLGLTEAPRTKFFSEQKAEAATIDKVLDELLEDVKGPSPSGPK